MVRPFDRTVIDRQLQALETDLEQFKQRYDRFVADWERHAQIQAELDTPDSAEDLTLEYDRLRRELEALEVRLDSQLFSWNGFGTVFWQVVRFLGLGLVLGWWLRGCAG